MHQSFAKVIHTDGKYQRILPFKLVVVLSTDGPVPDDGLLPLIRVQSKLSEL